MNILTHKSGPKLTHKSGPKVVLYEPRKVLHNTVTHVFESCEWDILDIRGDTFIEDFCSIADESSLIALGIKGTGKDIIPCLRAIHHFSSMNYQILVWLPNQDHSFKKLLTALGVRHIFAESTLYEELTDFTATFSLPPSRPVPPKSQHKKS